MLERKCAIYGLWMVLSFILKFSSRNKDDTILQMIISSIASVLIAMLIIETMGG